MKVRALASLGICVMGVITVLCALQKGAADVDLNAGLIGHWKLAGDCRDSSGMGNHGVARGIDLNPIGRDGGPRTAASFNGIDAMIEAPNSPALSLGTGDFTIAAWIETEEELDDVIGDIASKYDPDSRTGFNFNIKHHAGMTSSQANYRNLHFGIDSGRIDPEWTDVGRPGNTVFVMGLCVHEGALYAGTFETEADETGHIYRYSGGGEWIDCGSPDGSNAVMCLASHNGGLYAGTGYYNAKGSALLPSPNTTPGGHVYRYEGGKEWTDCGRLGEANDVFSLTEYRGDLYAMPLYSPGIFRYDGEDEWAYCGTPGDQRAMSMGVFNGRLYSAGNGSAGVLRYEGGDAWRECGKQGTESQTYSFVVYRGNWYAGTWPSGSVWRYDGEAGWESVGRLGEEKEVMALAVYNGKLYAGTLPLGQVYRYDGDGSWTLTGVLDATPEVIYRRVWTMAVYDGKLFAGTLPSGHLLSLEAGKSVTYDRELASGWRHVAAVRAGGELRLYVDGQRIGVSSTFDPADYDLTNDEPLRIGFGAHDYFRGKMADVRLYGRALTEEEVGALAGR